MNFYDHIQEHQMAMRKIGELKPKIDSIVELLKNVIENKGTIYTCGNGGSASDAMHFTAELVARYEIDRPSIRCVCLNSNVSNITAISNDYSYEKVFEKQLDGVSGPNDALIAWSTSGKSPNIIAALKKCFFNQTPCVLMTGSKTDVPIASRCHSTVIVSSNVTPVIQEIHGIINHVICGDVEEWYAREYCQRTNK